MPEHNAKKEKKPFNRNALVLAAFILIVIGGGIGGMAYWAVSNQTIYIDTASISAPLVNLSPQSTDVLNSVYVEEGQTIPPNTVVAEVGTELIKSTAGGLVVTVNNNIGKTVGPSDVIVTTIDPSQLRAVGEVQEDKGLADIKVGQRAVFTVDAFGGQQFTGIVDSISPTAQSSDVVFSISNQREEQNFDVKIAFDTAAYPQLKNGMSARIWVYKN